MWKSVGLRRNLSGFRCDVTAFYSEKNPTIYPERVAESLFDFRRIGDGVNRGARGLQQIEWTH